MVSSAVAVACLCPELSNSYVALLLLLLLLFLVLAAAAGAPALRCWAHQAAAKPPRFMQWLRS
jgi:hypothetical protein